MRTHRAIVTGGRRGIGRAIVERLSAEGARVLTCGRGDRPDDLPEDVLWVQADVSSATEAERIVAETNAVFGAVSLLVNNAGVQIEKTLMDTTDREWELVMGVNCQGVFNMSRAVLPQMTADGGTIINVGSISGNLADRSMAVYNASKAFVHGLTRSIAVDHGPLVRCNAVQPGWIMTEMAEDGLALASDPEIARRDALARHPAGRFGQSVDIAKAVLWLASEEAQFITGQCLTIDGGLTAASPLNPGGF